MNARDYVVLHENARKALAAKWEDKVLQDAIVDFNILLLDPRWKEFHVTIGKCIDEFNAIKKSRMLAKISEISSRDELESLLYQWEHPNNVFFDLGDQPFKMSIYDAIIFKNDLIDYVNSYLLADKKTQVDMENSWDLAYLDDVIKEVINKFGRFNERVLNLLELQEARFNEYLKSCPPSWRKREAAAYATDNTVQQSLTSALQSHEVGKVKKRAFSDPRTDREKYQKLWFKKEEKNEKTAQIEVFSQEIFRLFSPDSQPKTRLVLDRRGQTYVLSQGVKGYACFADDDTMSKVFSDYAKTGPREFRGAGASMVCAMLMDEIDFKPGNIGVNDEGCVIKIDGGCCLARMHGYPYTVTISEEDIRALPKVMGRAQQNGVHQTACNWLDVIDGGKLNPKSIATFGRDPVFRKEVNVALLKALLIDADTLHAIAAHYVREGLAKECVDEVLKRRDLLRDAACRNVSFCQFMRSPEAETIKQQFIEDLKQFTLAGKTPLVVNTDAIESNFRQINASFLPDLSVEVARQLTQYLTELSRTDKSKMINAFIFTLNEIGKSDQDKIAALKEAARKFLLAPKPKNPLVRLFHDDEMKLSLCRLIARVENSQAFIDELTTLQARRVRSKHER